MASVYHLSISGQMEDWGSHTVCVHHRLTCRPTPTCLGTSKYNSPATFLGCRGTFLASLSALSLLTIVSRHYEHRSHNALIIHHSKVLDRQLPATVSHEVNAKHGTRVTVRNLFGNLPVRVKQRPVTVQQRSEYDRLWETLKREATALLLGWGAPVSLKIRDGDNRISFSVNTLNSEKSTETCSIETGKTQSSQVTHMLNVLTQADYLSVSQWASWVPASAATSTLAIKGIISLEPAPSKNVQFISLGKNALSTEAHHNEIYDQVNRLFALSSFGTIDDDVNFSERDKTARRVDVPAKSESYTNRQLRVQKGVDRYPMFHLRISLKSDSRSSRLGSDCIDTEANLQAIIDVLAAMVTQWLKVHHFRPRQPRQRMRPCTSSADSSNCLRLRSPVSLITQKHQDRLSGALETRSETSSLKRKRSRGLDTGTPSGPSQTRAFADWSRIKSSKTFFHNGDSAASKAVDGIPPNSHAQQADYRTKDHTCPATLATFNADAIPQGALNGAACAHKQLAERDENVVETGEQCDSTILWTDPNTKKTSLLNARTGCVMPQLSSDLKSNCGLAAVSQPKNETINLMRLPARQKTAVENVWLDNVLKTWHNPVFRPNEKSVQHALTQESPAVRSDKMSKKSLSYAEVLAQVDRKFVLIKTRSVQGEITLPSQSPEPLVLVDQHAADERVQVEKLFEDLCRPANTEHGRSIYQSKLGLRSPIAYSVLEQPRQFIVSPQERTLFLRYAPHFAFWGILFDVVRPGPASNSTNAPGKEHHLLSIKTLPPVIQERCQGDPQVLIAFMRSTVWTYSNSPHLTVEEHAVEEKDQDWVRRLAKCPAGLVELINSRACRSAVMFNDELSLEECEVLIRKLSVCRFPFMCAHGRPSMVPLVDTGVLAGGGGLGARFDEKDVSFLQAWKQWKR